MSHAIFRFYWIVADWAWRPRGQRNPVLPKLVLDNIANFRKVLTQITNLKNYLSIYCKILVLLYSVSYLAWTMLMLLGSKTIFFCLSSFSLYKSFTWPARFSQPFWVSRHSPSVPWRCFGSRCRSFWWSFPWTRSSIKEVPCP